MREGQLLRSRFRCFPADNPEGNRSKYLQHHNSDPQNFFISSDTDLPSQIHIINQVKPALIIVDSINMIDQWNHGYGAKQIVTAYREAIGTSAAHVIFLSHLNKAGKVKGSTDLAHLTDVLVKLDTIPSPVIERKGQPIEDVFKMQIESKNRFGPTDRYCCVVHRDESAEWMAGHTNVEHQKFLELLEEQEIAEIQQRAQLDAIKYGGLTLSAIGLIAAGA